MAKKNETKAAVSARKALAAKQNRERAERNATDVRIIGIEGRSAQRVKVTVGKDGKAREVVSTKAVRNSKLIRTHERAMRRAAAGRAAARVAAASVDPE